MCGIAGIWDQNRPVDKSELTVMGMAIRARGPDGMGEWYADDASLGLLHRRLAIIDLSPEAAQPMVSPDGRYHIVFNGEIFNYRALKRELELLGVRFQTQSDSEVLLQMYIHHGVELFSKLRGMYAFAIWDAAKKGLLLGRDPFGIKPLYYAHDKGKLAFASQVRPSCWPCEGWTRGNGPTCLPKWRWLKSTR